MRASRPRWRRLQTTADASESERKEWEDKIDESVKDAWKQLADALTAGLDAHLDARIEVLNDDAGKILNWRIDAADAKTRKLYDIAFDAMNDQRAIVVYDQAQQVGLIDKISQALDVVDLNSNQDQWDQALKGAGQALQLLVGQKSVQAWLKIGGTASTVGTVANMWVNAGLTLYTEWTAARSLEEIDRNGAEFRAAAAELREKISKTVAQIKAAEGLTATEVRSCSVRS